MLTLHDKVYARKLPNTFLTLIFLFFFDGVLAGVWTLATCTVDEEPSSNSSTISLNTAESIDCDIHIMPLYGYIV